LVNKKIDCASRHLYFVKGLDFFIFPDWDFLSYHKLRNKKNILNIDFYFFSIWTKNESYVLLSLWITLNIIELFWSIHKKTPLIFTNVYLLKASETKREEAFSYRSYTIACALFHVSFCCCCFYRIHTFQLKEKNP
jgi:hypothetical protein